MNKAFLIKAVISIVVVLTLCGVVFAITPMGSETQDSRGDVSKGASIVKTQVAVKGFKDNTIETLTGKYNTYGAKVIDLSKGEFAKKPEGRSATLTFKDGRLIEVVFH